MPDKSFFKIVILSFLILVPISCQQTHNPEVPSDSITPQQQLAMLDVRNPVPVHPRMANHQRANMRDHLVVVMEVLQALANEDFEAVERSTERIAYSTRMGRMCGRMGAAAAGFADMGIFFHRTADTIIEAARKKDTKATLTAVSNTLATCAACHESYRQELVSINDWQELARVN